METGRPDTLRCLQSNPDIAPLFVHRSLSRKVKGGVKPEYSMRGNFHSQTLIDCK